MKTVQEKRRIPLQKEAYFFDKKCLTLRDETEWVELVSCGANWLASGDAGETIQAIRVRLQEVMPASTGQLFGARDAGLLIAKSFLE